MIIVDVELVGVEALTKSQVNNALKDAMQALGLRWRRRYLPQHFGNTAKTRYGYTPRAGERGSGKRFEKSYTARKLKAVGHSRPLEFTGEGKRLALNGPRTVYPTRDKVRIPLPRKFNLRPKGGRVKMADEIRAVRQDELDELTKFLVENIDRNFSRAGLTGHSRVLFAELSGA